MIAVEYRRAKPGEYEAVRFFLGEMGWASRVADAEGFRHMLEQTHRHVVAVDGQRVVGFARALCDDVLNGYISMVAVAPDYRRQGIGRELIHRLAGDDPHITWVLRSGRGTDGFWEKLGFRRSNLAMEKVRIEA